MNEIKMTVKEAIEQLTDLKRDREGFAENDEPDSVFDYDIKAIDVAVTALEENIKLNKQNEEIQNNNIEHYIRAKDAEDRCKTTEKQNKRLKELLKLAFEEIYKISELNEDVCFMECDSCNDCSFVCEETGICKWKHADEVEEVLKDEWSNKND